MKDRRIAICGPGRSGKDASAEYISSITSLRYKSSTSWYATEYVMKRLAENGITYRCLISCYNDRLNHRKEWARFIDEMNSNDPTYLYKECIKSQDILTGIRKRREIKAVKSEGLVDLVIWLDASKWCPPDQTMEFGPEESHIVIDNNWDLDSLKTRLMMFCSFSGLLRC